uniref:RRM domain-containing protein n=1 Tax=Mesocestoides corti TaxID=53468 RepID=A0A5K3FX88_MESCO
GKIRNYWRILRCQCCLLTYDTGLLTTTPNSTVKSHPFETQNTLCLGNCLIGSRFTTMQSLASGIMEASLAQKAFIY